MRDKAFFPNRRQKTQQKKSQPQQKMTLVLVPSDVELPAGSITLNKEMAQNVLEQSEEDTGPGEEAPAMNKRYIEHWDGASSMQESEPSMQKKYIEHWDGSNSMQQGEPTMQKRYIEHWDGSGAMQESEPSMQKKYIEHWDGSSAMQESEPSMQKRYIEHWDSSSAMHAADPRMKMSTRKAMSDIEGKLHIDPDSWSHVEPQAKDQLIIISTMAIMALFVGAISARRMRRRRGRDYGDCLSGCIENNVEDELAYDTATTASGGYSAVMGGVYDTFSQTSNGWRNDLEKFDV